MLNLRQNLCTTCFKPMPEGECVCPHCGAYRTGYARYPDLFAPLSVIGEYAVGETFSDSEDECTYYACNVLTEKPVLLTVYFPQGITENPVTRCSGGVNYVEMRISAGREDEYAEGELRFLEKYSCFLNPASPAVYGIEHVFVQRNIVFVVGMRPPAPEESRKAVSDFRSVYKAFLPLMDYIGTLSVPISIFAEGGRDFTDLLRLDGGIVRFVTAGCGRYRSEKTDENIPKIYNAYECADANGKATPASDVYNICMSMYYLMTGKLIDSRGRLYAEAMGDPGMYPLAMPSELGVKISEKEEKVLAKGLEPRSSNRWQNITELKSAFKSAAGGFFRKKI